MKEYDQVEVIVEKEEYAKEGVHKGMIGQILDPRCIEESWLVYFEDPITFGDEIGIPIKEKDLKLVWEAPVIGIGRRVLLLSSKYTDQGLEKGIYGTITAADEKEHYWIVEFTMPDGRKMKASIYEDHVAIRD